jgi:hypothetical protein
MSAGVIGSAALSSTKRRMTALTTPPLEHWNKAPRVISKQGDRSWVLMFWFSCFFAIFALATVIAYLTRPPLPDD